MRLIFGRDREVADWTATRIPHSGGGFGPCAAIGVADGEMLVAGIVFSNWKPLHGTMELSIVVEDPRAAQRGTIRDILWYPFEVVKVAKLWVQIPHTNERAQRFARGLGFKREATLARHFGKEHAVIYRLYREQFRQKYGRVEQCMAS